ncbi:hypothetical protein OEA41_004171 [Lepraria neglecta]|uniref:Replication termination factor 2 n=1 Tax=Lepraria neglecta TaxID=209136 RepID=A0AAD9Z6W9_9LECA|nr:hypothetical protein OEA41_004171 [Lepraria neglecta]
MGNDGGSIPTRRELVKEAARDLSTTQVKEIQTEQQEHYWSTCALSHQPLSLPVVSDALGTLYNKDAVIDHLLSAGQEDKQDLQARGEAFKDRLRSLRDVVEVKLQVQDGDEKSSATKQTWICPVTGKALGPGVKAAYVVPCGHAFSESAIKEMGGESCLQCNEPYTADNIIPILPTSQTEKDRLEQRIQKLKEQGLTHSLKKAPGSSKKRKKNTNIEEATVGDEGLKTQPEKPASKPESNIKNQDTAALTAKVLAEQEERNKRRKLGANDNVKSLFSNKNGMDEKHVDFMTRGFSIPANAKR